MQALPTLEDVARRAGTSVATAGRALGGYGKVAPATRDRILGAARELKLLRERSGAQHEAGIGSYNSADRWKHL